MRNLFAATLTLALLVPGAAGGAASSSWTGAYRLSGPDDLTVTLAGGKAHVALGPGHAGLQSVPVSTAGGHVQFRLPGRPQAVVFDGTLAGRRFAGTVRQGSARGTFTLSPGADASLTARGLFTAPAGASAVVDDEYGPARIVDLDSGRVRAIAPSGAGFAIGSGFAALTPRTGSARFGTTGATIEGRRASRLGVRQLEVRFRSGSATLAGTLSLPPGGGRHAAVAFVSGSGPTVRAYLPELAALFVRHGVAVLVYDKRGVGQSSGSYPGESPTSGTIDVLARDAAAAVRFLAAQPEIDPARVGLTGHSQAGWIVPLAASREQAVRFAVIFSGPAVTADENDLYQTLAGEGETAPQMSDSAIDAEVLRRGPGGVDPIPWIRKLAVPTLWLYGGKDHIVPPRLSEQRLAPIAAEPGRDFTVVDFPNANHALVETRTGLTTEMLRSDSFAPGMFAQVGAWLAKRGLGG